MWRQSFGLLEKSYSHDTTGSFLLGKWLHVPLSTVPLCSAVVDVAIQDYVADVASELIYQNKSQVSREVLFVFPLGPHMAIYSFQACSEDAKVQAMLRDEAQQLHEATGGWENLKYLQDQSNCPGEVFACFLGTLPPGREVVVTLRYVQELPREPDGAAHFVLPPTLHPHTKHYAWNCLTSKLPYSLLLTASLQSPRGVANVQANFALTPLIYTARDRSTAQVSLAGRPPGGHDLELLVYFGEPTAVSAVVEKGAPGAPPGSLLGDPMVLVMLAPSIPEAVPGQRLSGEFIFLLDTTFLKHAQDSLLFLLKSLPLGCYFNIYCYEESSVGIYPQSVEYTQDNLTEAMRRIPSAGSSLGDTNLLGTLRSIYNTSRPRGHTRQLFIFMAGPPPDKEAIAAEVCRHRNSHRCFSFCFSEDSAALATALASETGGEAAYVSSDNSMILVVSKCLKRALKLAAEEVSLSWTLPCGLEVEVLGGTPQSIFQGQHSLLYAQIHGQAQDTTVAKGVMTLKYSLDGQDVSHSIEFPLCPQGDGRLAGHRLAARCLLKRLLPEAASGSGDEPRHRAVEISLASGIICPFTSYVGVRTSQRVTWYRGPLALLPPRQSLIPCQTIELRGSIMSSSCHRRAIWVPPGWLTAVSASWLALRRLTHGIAHLSQQGACSKACKPPPPPLSSLKHVNPEEFVLRFLSFGPWSTKDIAECQELVALQNVDGSWALGSGLASVLEVDEAEIKGKMPGEVLEPSIWATVLAVTWLNRNDKCYRDICELLEAKAVTWLCSRAVSQLDKCLEAANTLLGTTVEPSVFRL
ncbi:von Willebrand factor A domain-containing protein 5A-like isoform X2 [Harpia harpyja]|uniref:von Willebrand factor A domain-containing protein 5A-like isoform X2 n=1 Tax=Harpia harpyja TaxID=202280 RepID=UPI0022B1FEA0|nr:von Willebrand factor A domain-containing protein 5A-like isoform X2 [Harpia harpyja]XP_052640863.1 von Willebrand factor A domain-containing protein 5A-like isoform X2 [Harpia harpyja]